MREARATSSPCRTGLRDMEGRSFFAAFSARAFAMKWLLGLIALANALKVDDPRYPVSKVVKLLQDMQKKLEEEADADKKVDDARLFRSSIKRF